MDWPVGSRAISFWSRGAGNNTRTASGCTATGPAASRYHSVSAVKRDAFAWLLKAFGLTMTLQEPEFDTVIQVIADLSNAGQ